MSVGYILKQLCSDKPACNYHSFSISSGSFEWGFRWQNWVPRRSWSCSLLIPSGCQSCSDQWGLENRGLQKFLKKNSSNCNNTQKPKYSKPDFKACGTKTKWSTFLLSSPKSKLKNLLRYIQAIIVIISVRNTRKNIV